MEPEVNKMGDGLASTSAPMSADSTARSWNAAYRRAEETLTKMRLEEKRSLMEGTGYHHKRWFRLRKWLYSGNAVGVPRLGIPSLKMQDSGSGFHTVWAEQVGTVTCWPSQLALASMFDPESVRFFAEALGKEFVDKGANVILGPSVEVQRVARAGRNYERLSGEDPYLGSKLVEAFVKGIQSQGILAVMKHWIFNDQETNRQNVSAIVDERTAWELYYPPFEAAIEAGVAGVMCSYNRIGDSARHACSDEKQFNILRKRLGFKGWVVSDWWAMDQESRPAWDVDQEMPGSPNSHGDGPWFQSSKELPLQAVNEATTRILASIYHVGLDDVSRRSGCSPLDEGSVAGCKGPLLQNVTNSQHRALALELATHSVILLQNREGVLPLMPGNVSAIAVIGAAAEAGTVSVSVGGQDDWFAGDYYSGGGSGHVEPGDVITPLQGIRERAQAAGIKVHVPHPAASVKGALAAAKDADVVLLVAAATSGESVDRPDLHLDDGADELIEKVAASCATAGKRVIVLLQIPGAVVMPWRDSVDGILAMFLGGQEAGAAWGAVLFGDHAPTGRLPVMMPATEADTIKPSTLPKSHYAEGVATSYRSPTFNAAFPFGHGLTYTRFKYGHPRSEPCGRASLNMILAQTSAVGEAAQALKRASKRRRPAPAVCIGVKIHNEGHAAGRTVAQLYVEYPYAPAPARGTASRPLLKGFQKTKLLMPGDFEQISFQLFPRDLAYYDTDKDGGDWRQVDDVIIHVGESSVDYRHSLRIKRDADGAWPHPPSHTKIADGPRNPAQQSTSLAFYVYMLVSFLVLMAAVLFMFLVERMSFSATQRAVCTRRSTAPQREPSLCVK